MIVKGNRFCYQDYLSDVCKKCCAVLAGQRSISAKATGLTVFITFPFHNHPNNQNKRRKLSNGICILSECK